MSLWVAFLLTFVGACTLVAAIWFSKRLRTHNRALLASTQEDLERRREVMQKEMALEAEKLKAAEELELEKLKVSVDLEKKLLGQARSELNELKEDFADRDSQLRLQEKELEQNVQRSDRMMRMYRQRLQGMARLTEEEAKNALMEDVMRGMEAEFADLKKEMLRRTEKEVKDEASRILVDAMQRLAQQSFSDITATTVILESEDLKGRIIGREGRNIRSFESLTGTTLMIDENPGYVLVSCFDPVRREVAKIALEALVKDGRIHPSSIEERVNRASEEVNERIAEYGERAADRLHLHNMHPEILKIVGQLHFRLSNNQNTLDHSVEVAHLCGLIAAELGCDVQVAKRCGLYHDLGKVIDQEHEGSHAIVAGNLLKQYGEDERVVNAVAASHGEEEVQSLYAGILHTADAISSTRPGVRSTTMEGYIKRIADLEGIVKDEPGVLEAYAMHAGRELRIMVAPDKISDVEAMELSRRVKSRIEDELTYPSTIKVTVIRERRVTATAK